MRRGIDVRGRHFHRRRLLCLDRFDVDLGGEIAANAGRESGAAA